MICLAISRSLVNLVVFINVVFVCPVHHVQTHILPKATISSFIKTTVVEHWDVIFLFPRPNQTTTKLLESKSSLE